MGKCILTFDQIEILNKKSDSEHSDNDWLFITWFVKNQIVRTDKIPLVNQNGSRMINSGDHLLPTSSEVACEDTDPVTAAFVVMNLGSYDWNEQIEAAGKIASKFAEGAAEAYLKAVKFVLENLGQFGADPTVAGFSKFVAEHFDEFAPAIKDSVGAFIEDVLVPLFEEIVAEVLLILGQPNCNGPVFHDIAVFRNPTWPEPPLTLWNVYTADSMSGCGDPAKTSVHFTLDRDLDFVPQFPNTPPPLYVYIPSVNESPSNWIGQWANDPISPTPLIKVEVASSTTASGLFSVTVEEKVDKRFNIVFEAKADPISPITLQLLPYSGDVPGAIQPWFSKPVSPGALQVFGAKFSPATSGSSAAGSSPLTLEKPEPVEPYIALTWKRPFSGGTPLTFAKGAAAESFIPGGSETSLFLEIADGFRIKDRDVTLAFYNVLANGQVVGRALRYIRGATTAYTRADWMLAKWKANT